MYVVFNKKKWYGHNFCLFSISYFGNTEAAHIRVTPTWRIQYTYVILISIPAAVYYTVVVLTK